MMTTLPAEHYPDDRGEFNQTQRFSTIHPSVASMIARYKNEALENQASDEDYFDIDAIFGDDDESEEVEDTPGYTAENVLGNRDPTLNPSMGPADSINHDRTFNRGQRFDDSQLGRIKPNFSDAGMDEGTRRENIGVISHRDSMQPIGQRMKPDAYGNMQAENMWTTKPLPGQTSAGTETNTPLGPRGMINQFIDPEMQREIGPQMALPMDSASVQARQNYGGMHFGGPM